MIVINPDFGTNVLSTSTTIRTVKLRSLLANSALENTAGVPKLMLALRNLLAMPVDRYLIISKDSAQKLVNNLGLNLIVSEKISDPEAGSFEVGEVVTGERLWNYLAADSNGVNPKMQRVASFGKVQLESIANLGGSARLISNAQSVVDGLETNLTKAELLDMLVTSVSGLRLQTSYLTTSDGRFVQDKLGGYISPDYTEIDQKVQKVLVRTDVLKEQGRIEVYNATRTSGLATSTKRLIENIGGNVIRAGNYADIEERTKLYVTDVAKYKNNIKAIQQVLGGKVILVDQDFPQGHTGDMVLVIGQDNAN